MNAPLNLERHLKRAFEQLKLDFDTQSQTLWMWFAPAGRACFNPGLLQDIKDFGNTLTDNGGAFYTDQGCEPVQYLVQGSTVPGIFNLGGDLNTFRSKITSKDKGAMRAYAYACIDVIWTRLNRYGSDITTVTLMQGQALGGGFEAALCSDVIIAEEQSTMGLPEVLFNLFPGMGALSLLARKIGMREAERLVLSGRVCSAQEMYDLGIVDVIAPTGKGREVVIDWIRSNRRRSNAYQAVQRAKDRVSPVTYRELLEITDIWVDAALRLTDRDLRMMSKLIDAQTKLATDHTEPVCVS